MPLSSRDPGVAFDEFVTAHSRRLLHLAELLVGTVDAEDLVQGALVRMYPRWSRIEQNDPLGYARRCLLNAATDRWRRRTLKEVPFRDLPDLADPSIDVDMNVDRDSVLRALGRLTSRERAVIVLRYYEDLPETDIAADLGIAPGTVKSTCNRALRKLRVSPHLNAPRASSQEACT